MKSALKMAHVEGALNLSGGPSTGRKAAAGQHQWDPMHRFTATPHCAALPVMGHTIRLETNNSKLLAHMVHLFARYPGSPNGEAEFLWRIVVEPDSQGRPPWPARHAFSDHALRFAEFGQRSFLAVDLEAKEAIGNLSEGLAKDELGLTSPFLDNVFCLTAGSLGLVSVWANCVARKQRGVLLFGGPKSGKTSASYLAEEMGLDFHADEGAFLEIAGGNLRSWAGFWPATFRAEALQYFPRLKKTASPCFHSNFTVYHRTEPSAPAQRGLPVTPVCCLFLERQASTVPKLSRISRDDLARLLAEYLLFDDDDRFAGQQAVVLKALAELPGYLLRYGDDPAVAAATARDLLVACPNARIPGSRLTHASSRSRLCQGTRL